MLISELRRAWRVSHVLDKVGPTAARLALRHFDAGSIPIRINSNSRLSLRGSRGVRVSDLAILEELLVDDHYRLREVVHPEFKILDIGAHIGIFAMLAALRVGPKGHVLSVEASPENYTVLMANATANPHLPWQAVNIAAAEGPGKTALSRSDWNTGGHRTGLSGSSSCLVPTLGLAQLLDQIPGGKADLLKLDCEGCEFAVLDGADEDTLKRVGTMIIEFHHFDGEDGVQSEFTQRQLLAVGFVLEVLSEVTYPGEGKFRTVIARRSD